MAVNPKKKERIVKGDRCDTRKEISEWLELTLGEWNLLRL